jgi:DNA polymerase I-like protein with 3'-5' exonuclease and polymerase domains
MSAFGLASRLGIPPGEGRSIIDAYFAQYPGIRQEMERIREMEYQRIQMEQQREFYRQQREAQNRAIQSGNRSSRL